MDLKVSVSSDGLKKNALKEITRRFETEVVGRNIEANTTIPETWLERLGNRCKWVATPPPSPSF